MCLPLLNSPCTALCTLASSLGSTATLPSTPFLHLFRESALQPQKSLCFSYLPCGFACGFPTDCTGHVLSSVLSPYSYTPTVTFQSPFTPPLPSYDFNFTTLAFNCFQNVEWKSSLMYVQRNISNMQMLFSILIYVNILAMLSKQFVLGSVWKSIKLLVLNRYNILPLVLLPALNSSIRIVNTLSIEFN